MMGHGMFTERMQYRLGLTDDQQLQIDALIKAHQAEFEPFHVEMTQARLALYDAIHAETIDDAAIRDAATRVGELEADRAVAQAEMFQKIRGTLTPEQQAEMTEMIGEMREFQEDNPGMMQHRGRHRGGPGWGRGR
jgi:Spy/CpxP family protein refolding chaperone